MMERCKNCKWWNIDEDEWTDFPGFSNGLRSCSAPQVGGGNYDDKARNMDDSLNSYEPIGTGPEFGCVHFLSRIKYAFVYPGDGEVG